MEQNELELHVCENGTWGVAERYKANDKEEAINDAKRRLQSPGVSAVRVVHEQFDSNDCLFKLKTLYRQVKPGSKVPPAPDKPKSVGAKPAAPVRKAGPAAAPAAAPVRGKPAAAMGGGAAAPGKQPSPPEPAAGAKPVAAAAPAPAPAPAKKERDPNQPMALGTRIAVGGGVGLVVGIAGALAVMSNAGVQNAMADVSLSYVALGLFLASFGLTFYITGGAERRAARAAAEANPEGAAPSTATLADDFDLSTPDEPMMAARPQAAPASFAAAEPAPIAAPPPAAAAPPPQPPTPQAAAPAATPAPAAAAANVSPEAQELRLRLLKFLHDCLADGATKPYLSEGKLDPRNRFGFHLLMLGAGQYCLAAHKDPKLQLGQVIETALAVLGTDAAKANAFAAHIAQYSRDAKHNAMIRAGAETMRDYLRTGKLTSATLSKALQGWNLVEGQQAQADAQAQGDIVAIMFTDMVSSVNITQKLGDEGMMKVVQTHNLIVGAVLKTHRGKQVKHTGDGIMAMFPRISDGIAAAAEIQRQVTEYNSVTTGSPLKLRIGVSAGKPIREGDDYFGTVVQTAARLCAVAQADEVVVPDSIRQLPGCDAFAYEQPYAVPLKGFPEPQLVRKVIWATAGAARIQAAAAG